MTRPNIKYTSLDELKALCNRINQITGSPLTSHTVRVRGDKAKRYEANIGNYHLEWSYGGVRLVRITSLGGGITAVTGLSTRRDCYDQIHAFIQGLEARQLTVESEQSR